MKKRFLVMLTATIYVVQALLLYILSPVLLFIKTTNPPLPVSKYLLIVFFLLSIIFIIVNIGTIMGFKLAFIPFFISHSYWFILAMGGTANPFLMILWFVIPFLFLFYAYLVLFSTSSYLIVQILKLRKNGTLTKGQCILHIMMQLLFFIDVVDSVYLFFKYRKCN